MRRTILMRPSGNKKGSLSSQILRLARKNPEYRSEMRPVLQILAAAKSSEDRAKVKREYKRLFRNGPQFGILSSHQGKSEAEEKALRTQLLADLQHHRYRKVSPLRGEWELFPEGAVLIQNMRPKDLFEIGKKYDQEYVLLASELGLLGIYQLKGEPSVRVIVDPKGDPAFRALTDMTPYSKSTGLETELGLLWSKDFPWDGQTAMTRKSLRQMILQKGLRNVLTSD